MRPTSITTYFNFGGEERFLHQVKAGYQIKKYIIPNIDYFLNKLYSLGLNVTERTEAIDDLKMFKKSLAAATEDACLTQSQADLLEKIMEDIYKTLYAEIIGKTAYVESFIGKLRDEHLNGEVLDTLAEAKVLAEDWRREYDRFRPHSSLGYRPPAPEAYMTGKITQGLVH